MKGKIAAVLAIFSSVAYVDSVNQNTNVIQDQIIKTDVRMNEPVVEYTLEENKAKIKYGIQQVQKIEATTNEIEKARLKSKFIQDMGIDTNEFQKRFMSQGVQSSNRSIETMQAVGKADLLAAVSRVETQTARPKAKYKV